MQRRIREDGSVELAAGDATFTFTRLRRGAMLIAVTGDDDGSFGTATMDELGAEIGRFGAIDLFLDTRGVTGVAPSVSDQWASFFRANRAGIKSVRVLATSKLLRVTASMVMLFSRTGDLMRLYTEVEPFERALEAASPRAIAEQGASSSRASAAPRSARASRHDVVREVDPDGTVRIQSAGCSFVYRRPATGILLVTITGDDKGEFGTAPRDEIDAEIARFGPIDLFVDARGATGADTEVSDQWTAWFRDNQGRLARASILATSKVMHLVISIAKHFSRTGDLIRIYSTPEPFEEAMRARAASR